MKRKSLSSLLLFLVLATASAALAQDRYFPPKNGRWEIREPREVGFNGDKLNQAVEFAKTNEYKEPRDLRVAILNSYGREPYFQIVGPTRERGGPAGMIVRHGFIAALWGDTRRVDMTFSVTKSFLSTVAGLALDDGLIRDVNDPAGEYVWDKTFDGSHNSKITWQHLLTQSSDWYGELFGTPDWADRPPREGGIEEWRHRELKDPGTSFKYNDVRVNVLAYSLLQVWRKPLPFILKERVMDPIGASSTWRWLGYETSWLDMDGLKMQSVSGGGHFGGGLFISAEDQARYGLLFLRNGNWNSRQLISEKWIELLQKPSAANESYGYLWWLNRGREQWRGVPESVYYASGFGGNYIVIDNEHDLVVVIRWIDPPRAGELVRRVIESITD